MTEPPEAVFRFGAFRYDPEQRLLFRGDEMVPLQPKALDLLEILLRRRGEAIPRGELIKALWPDCVVEEIGLARNISILRKALGENAESYIETVPRRGYRFASAATSEPTGARTGSPVRAWLLATAGVLLAGGVLYWQFYRPSSQFTASSGAANIAVLPFDRLNREVDLSLGQAFSDTLAAEMSKLARVRVISPSTVRRYRRVRIPISLMGRLLGLDGVVEGTAQRFGPMTRVSIRLSDVHSGRLIWADSYDISAGDLGAAEMAVARTAAMQIDARLTPR